MDPALEGEPEDGDPCLAGQARSRIGDAAATERFADRRGGGSELDQLAFLELRVGGDERMAVASELAALLEQSRGGFERREMAAEKVGAALRPRDRARMAPDEQRCGHPRSCLRAKRIDSRGGDAPWTSDRWRARVANRWWNQAGCPFCTNQPVSKKNALATTLPDSLALREQSAAPLVRFGRRPNEGLASRMPPVCAQPAWRILRGPVPRAGESVGLRPQREGDAQGCL